MSKATDNLTILVGKFSQATVFFRKNLLPDSSIDPLKFEIDFTKLANLRLPIDGVDGDDEYKSYFEAIRNKPELSESDIQITRKFAEFEDIKRLEDIGDFEDLKEKLGTFGIDADDLKVKSYEIIRKGHRYRFVDPDNLSKESIKTLKKAPNAHVFSGGLSGMLFSVSNKKISAQYLAELT